uniref:Uncharacterized protein AlNc14C103G6114 n=1 Tax=Albugo laibachii Nc14 TaxID=890382 RepID=F0WHQ7_9STRA|nr:conserved hypothetical protein [Albugo laibachii Nc14]CCA23712.1 conserved hypothetical protein [Albugo laibachii Nc14]|eukprot:CCA23712.1 conserved hypothetical protein [Albugo laibachii Nc14]
MYKVLEGVASNESQFIELSIMFRRIAEKTAGLSTIPSRWTIQNTAKNCGQLEVALPFPNRVGLHSIHFNEATCISDILTTLHQHDSHLKCVDVVTTDGLPMARSMQLKELTCIHQFMIRLNDNHFTIQNDISKTSTRETGRRRNGFEHIRATIEQDPRSHLPIQEYYELCASSGIEKPLALRWLRELERRNVLVHFHESKLTHLPELILLHPTSANQTARVENALDVNMTHLHSSRIAMETHAKELAGQTRSRLELEVEIRETALKVPNRFKWAVLTTIYGFYGSLMYCVWDVYSWDVMEPITYFIGFSAVLGNSFYHSFTKKDATYTNIWQKNYRARLENHYAQHQCRKEDIIQLQDNLAQAHRDVTILQRLKHN